MKKIILTLSLLSITFLTSCDPKDKQQDGENPIEETEMEENGTPEQYQGSTGVEDGDNNDLVAEENIELKEQEFKGSFSSEFTESFDFTVLNESVYNFKLVTEHPEITYVVKKATGEVVVESTSGDSSATLTPGDYEIDAALAEGETAGKDTEFTILVR